MIVTNILHELNPNSSSAHSSLLREVLPSNHSCRLAEAETCESGVSSPKVSPE